MQGILKYSLLSVVSLLRGVGSTEKDSPIQQKKKLPLGSELSIETPVVLCRMEFLSNHRLRLSLTSGE